MHAPSNLQQLPRRPRAQAGFAIVAILLVVGVMTAIALTYIRHITVRDQQSIVGKSATEAREAAHSGVQYAQQMLSVGKSELTKTLANGDGLATVQISDLSENHGRIQVQALDDYGMGSTVLAEVARVPVPQTTHPDNLPRISAGKVTELLEDPTIPKYYYSGMTWIRDQDIYGIVVVRNTSAVLFDNVTIHGCVVSEKVLTEDPFGDFDMSTVPCALPDGNLRITPADFLPGVAVVMPDGVFTEYHEPSSVQIEGDIVAYKLSLDTIGAIRGNIATVEPLDLSGQIERPGANRGYQRWGKGLDMHGVWSTEYMAFVPRHDTVGSLPEITNFAFPPVSYHSGTAHAATEEESEAPGSTNGLLLGGGN